MPTEPSASRPTTRLAAAERREAILDAAEMVFVHAGLHATGTRDLAQASGVTEPVLYRHFPGKTSLFIAVVSRMIDQGIQDLSQAKTNQEKNHAIRRALEALLLIDAAADVEEATAVARNRRTALEKAIATSTGHPGATELTQRLGELVIHRIDQA
ncbi:MAG: helix-turn-helix domain-containing protein [Planctomycetota bacterium]|nr:helix-turn-helix domain-containing protein [Planctomycetota bacterium]